MNRQTTASTCCYCGVGCGVLIEHDGSQILGVSGDPSHPANFGKLCSKGSSLHLTGDLAARALYPELRLGKGLARSRTDWDTALEHAANVFAETIAEHGPDSVAFYISGQLLTEDYYSFNKLARALVGTNNIDSNSRLCMSSAVVGYKRSLGADAPPCSYEDLESSDCVMIVGSNMAYAHPVLFRRLEEAKARRPQMKVLVIDPRRTDTCDLADLHLAILPGTDVALFHGILHLLLWEDWIDRDFIQAHTDGLVELKRLVHDYTPQMVTQLCGISVEQLRLCAEWVGTSASFLSLWCMGLNQSTAGSAKNSALINLHLATGTIGRPGCGPFSLTGQPNAMGGRETGSLSNLLPGHREAANPEHRAEVAAYWGVDQLPASTGLTAIELFEQMQAGKIKALWIACTNPAQSLPDQNTVRQALEACPFVVLQEAFRTTETARYADLLLPAASWGEKEGTVTNSERRISHVRRAIAPPGEARPDWAITVDFARRLEQRLCPGKPGLFAFEQPAQIFDEYKLLTRGRDLDLSGISHALLDRIGPQQWPFPADAVGGTPRLYTDGFFPTETGRAHFVADPYRAAKEQRDARFPLTLITGRLRDQWHGMSRTGTAAQLFGHVSEAVLSLHPDELRRHRLKEGDLVSLKSRRGSVIVAVGSDDSVRPGQAFLPMHWGDRFLKGGVNALTQPAFDPLSKQPELKHSGVRLEAVRLPWHLFALIEGDVQQHFEALRPLCDGFAYVSLSLTGRERPALLIRAAHHEAPALELLKQIDQLLGLNDGPVMAYDDPRRSIGKRVKIEKGRITAIRLAGETLARHWLQSLWLEGRTDEQLRRWLLAPLSAPPGGGSSSNKTLCNCKNVSESAVCAGIARGLDLNGLKQELGCGTQCGSCVPEIKRLLASGKQPIAIRV
ncbi:MULTISPECIES: nitrate reductase [unclassified Pseudomonas]|uniref:nitrate reductase n=1 Tax=unclassified Pseudomonas TaxID=196821 RepID=UPI000C86A580|nr:MULTISPECIES: nitrate reductase [unclassified Pseudomonas]NVZ14721.1 molybdopterin-dependent oxidoreductase [Pseudomonas sp. IPO3775]NVZ96910.1 molybdopterin-dependent oxidoreductase [Pseudomonas sp. B6001]NWB17394.1 molybdopterin-dependent oxidoreductase [Pseudomonas sp. D6002]PMU23704.1 nitrate reductase [Pseudomonas sp. GP01-A9]PMU28789.1 nitrate reductase [Pseudomonas sp. GP01-A13]